MQCLLFFAHAKTIPEVRKQVPRRTSRSGEVFGSRSTAALYCLIPPREGVGKLQKRKRSKALRLASWGLCLTLDSGTVLPVPSSRKRRKIAAAKALESASPRILGLSLTRCVPCVLHNAKAHESMKFQKQERETSARRLCVCVFGCLFVALKPCCTGGGSPGGTMPWQPPRT